MKLDKVAAVAEIVSSVAIVVTLAYLAVQTQQTNRALFANSREATMTADLNFLLAQVDHPHLNVSGRDEPLVDPIEQRRFESLTVAFFRVREFVWFQHQYGIMDDAAFDSYMATAIRRISDEYVRPIWTRFESEFDPDFVEYVNQRIDATR